MRFRFTLLLLALNIAVFGAILFLRYRGDGGAEKDGLAARIGRNIAEAERIELRGAKLDSPRVLRREGDTWKVVEPVRWSANYFAVNRILNQLQFLEEAAVFSVDEVQASGQSLADFGLEEPILRLTIADGTGATELLLGKTTDIGNNVYILGPSRERIYVIDRSQIDSLAVDLAELRSREIFEIPVFEVDALGLRLRSSGSSGDDDLKVRLARTRDGWSFEAPVAAEADPKLVDSTINALTSSTVRRFVEQGAGDTAAFGLENPAMRVTLYGNKRDQSLVLGNRDASGDGPPTYFARLQGNPTVFTVAAKPFDELREAQEALREREFMRFDPDGLTTIGISRGDRQLRLQKLETGSWQVLQSGTGNGIEPHRADPGVLETLITNLRELRATGFAVDAPAPADLERLGFDAPRRTVRLDFSDGDTIVLRLAHPPDENEKLYARRDDNAFIYEVDRRETLAQLPLNHLHYRSRVLEDLPEAAEVVSLELSRPGDAEHIKRYAKPEDAGWEAVAAELSETDAAALEEILGTLREFRVREYRENNYNADGFPLDPDDTLPWRLRLSAEILLPGGGEGRIVTQDYTFTERLSGTVRVGGSKRHDVTFEITRDLLDALEVWTTTETEPGTQDAGDPAGTSAGNGEPEDTAREEVTPVPDPAPTTGANNGNGASDTP